MTIAALMPISIRGLITTATTNRTTSEDGIAGGHELHPTRDGVSLRQGCKPLSVLRAVIRYAQ